MAFDRAGRKAQRLGSWPFAGPPRGSQGIAIELTLSPTIIPNVLSIAGSDPSGGAGIQADLKTFAALRCHGLSVVTALTAQNTQAVREIFPVPAKFVAAQIDALLADSTINAVKIGMTASAEIVETLAERLAHFSASPIVLDPVLASSSGEPLAMGNIAESLVQHLASRVSLVTPNLSESAKLSGKPAPRSLPEMQEIARYLHGQGFAAVLVKGGHLESGTCDDVFFDGAEVRVFSGPRIPTRNTHGTGCTLSAAIAAYLAQGMALATAIQSAKLFVQEALGSADQLSVGKGPGPLNHFHRFW